MRAVLIALLAGAVAMAPALGAEPHDSKDSTGITALLKRWEDGITQKNIDLLFSCLSEEIVYVEPVQRTHGTDAHVLTGQGLRDSFQASLGRPVTDNLEVIVIDATDAFSLRQDGDVAQLLLTQALRVQTTRGKPSRIGSIDRFYTGVRYEQGRWTFDFMFPRFVDSRVVVTGVEPKSQADKLGVRVGDIVANSLMMSIVTSEQLIWRSEMFYDQPADRPLRLLVRRGQQLLPFIFCPGPTGLKTRNCLEGHLGTETLTGEAARDHPATATIEKYHAALKEANGEGIVAALCPAGFIFYHGLPSVRTQTVLSHVHAATTLPEELQRISSQLRLESLHVSDIRLIIHCNVGLASWRLRVETKTGQTRMEDVVVCLVMFDQQWSIVGMPWQVQHRLGVDIE